MAVRRSVFDALGGFDEGYRNGFEDVDFCLRVVAAGHRIVYQPASTLYHLESQTEGRKVHDQANGRRLFERWQARWAEIGDEDVVLVPDGWCGSTLDDPQQTRVLAPITDAADRVRWEAVARTQRALLDGDEAVVREMLANWHDWPVDRGVRRWVERLRERYGLAATAAVAAYR
jgi:hypothetical protein